MFTFYLDLELASFIFNSLNPKKTLKQTEKNFLIFYKNLDNIKQKEFEKEASILIRRNNYHINRYPPLKEKRERISIIFYVFY